MTFRNRFGESAVESPKNSNLVSLKISGNLKSSDSVQSPKSTLPCVSVHGQLELLSLSETTENSKCTDCKNSKVSWASVNIGVFLCAECARIHQSLEPNFSQIQSLDLDSSRWTLEQVEYMKRTGNEHCKQIYEYKVPAYYFKGAEARKSSLVRKNWIIEKYIKKTFVKENMNEEKTPSSRGVFNMPERPKIIIVSKFSRMSMDKWQKRMFELNGMYLNYYKSPSDSYPLESFNVRKITIQVPDDEFVKSDNYDFDLLSGEKTLHLSVDSLDKMFDWIHAIRRAKLFYSVLDTDSKFVTGPHSQFSGEIASQEKVIKSGWIRKQGGKTQTWKNRWFILTLNSDNGIPTLLYFKEEPSDSNNTMTPEGEIPLFRCLISKADENYFKDGTIAIFTHFRHFFLEIGSPAEFKDWLDALIKMNEISFTNSQIVDFSCEFQDSEIRW